MRPASRRFLCWCLLPVIILGAGLLFRWWRTPAPLIVSQETTYITSPLLPDGRPDYVAFLNERGSQGVAPENNAAVPLAVLAWPYDLSGENIDEYFRRLGTSVPKSSGAPILIATRLRVERSQLPQDEVEVAGFPERFDRDGHPWHRKHLEQHDAALTNLVDELSRRDRYFSPLIPTDDGLFGSCAIELLSVGNEVKDLLVMRSRMRLQNGDLPGAIDDALSIIRLGRLMSSGVVSIEFIVGCRIERHGIHSLCSLLYSQQFTREQIQTLRKQIGQLPPWGDAAKASLDCRVAELDYLAALRMIPDSEGFAYQFKGLPRLEPNVDINDVLRSVNRRHDELGVFLGTTGEIRNRNSNVASIETGIKVLPHQMEPTESMDWLFSHLGRKPPIPISNELLENYGYSIQELLNAVDAAMVRRSLLETALALAEFRADHNSYPEDLQELVPGYLTSIPPDPWRSAPLYYQRTLDGYALYSFGPNGWHDSGWMKGESDDDPAADDIRIGARPPVPPVPGAILDAK